jgi:hypothetical protein
MKQELENNEQKLVQNEKSYFFTQLSLFFGEEIPKDYLCKFTDMFNES